jgi:hypothetical protein
VAREKSKFSKKSNDTLGYTPSYWDLIFSQNFFNDRQKPGTELAPHLASKIKLENASVT